MEAGREMDALIAEKVMGLAKEDIFEHEHVSDEVGYVPISDQPISQVPRYSTDIAAAWEVVEKLDDGRGHFILERDPEPLRWEAIVYSGGEMIKMEADTAPLAICKAALFACGVKID